MFKYLFPFLSIFAVFYLAIGQNNIAPPIQTVTTQTASFEEGRETKRRLSSVKSFTREGFLTEQITYKKGKPDSRTSYSHNESGDKLEQKVVDAEGNLKLRELWTYDSKGLLRKTFESALVSAEWYRFDYPNLEQIKIDPSTVVFQLNEQGEISSTHKVSRYGEEVTELSYDDKGRLLESATYGSSDNAVSRSTYVYDGKGKETERMVLRNGRIMQYTTIYNDYNDIESERVFDTSSGRSFTNIYIYDYDEHGNWLKKTSSVLYPEKDKAEPKSVTYRIITYFN